MNENVDLHQSTKKAENHFVRAVGRKVLQAWNNLLRNRGNIVRLCERQFYEWAIWAPKQKRLRLLRERLGKKGRERERETVSMGEREIEGERVRDR